MALCLRQQAITRADENPNLRTIYMYVTKWLHWVNQDYIASIKLCDCKTLPYQRTVKCKEATVHIYVHLTVLRLHAYDIRCHASINLKNSTSMYYTTIITPNNHTWAPNVGFNCHYIWLFTEHVTYKYFDISLGCKSNYTRTFIDADSHYLNKCWLIVKLILRT